ncbi:hypothetical protein JCM1393_17020 [Clostridium carnis]
MGDENIVNLKEFNNCVTKINKWYVRQSKLLTIITCPYNSSLIYSSIINEVTRSKKKVLYIWGGNTINDILIKSIKLINNNLTYSYLDKGEADTSVTFVNFKNVNYVKGYYDLCIVDDISKFSVTTREDLIEIIEYQYLFSRRIIVYSIEKIVSMGSSIEVSPLLKKGPFIEPRILNTRVKLDEDIPYSLYDYLIWFKNNKRKIVICVPSEEKLEKVYKYYINSLKIKDVKPIKYLKGESFKNIEDIVNKKNKSIFIITNNISEYIRKIDDLDIIVLFADDIFYNYKKLLYLCAVLGKDIKKPGEILLVSKDISNDMDETKNISRRFNKIIWEKGLLKK